MRGVPYQKRVDQFFPELLVLINGVSNDDLILFSSLLK
jgi:hypothetical protein